jgi:chromosome segregation ATPase
VAKTNQASTESPGEWIENELRDSKARLHKVEGELAQALKMAWSLDADMQKVLQGIAVSASVEGSLQAFREEVRQMRDQLGKVQDRQGNLGNRMEQLANQRQADTGRDRQDVGLIAKQVDAINRVIEHFDGRMKALEEVARHVEEEVAANRLMGQSLERGMDETQTRSARSLEATMRLDQEFARFGGEIERLEKDAGGFADRMSLILEQVRKTMERQDQLENVAATIEETHEAIQRANYEREQMAVRFAGLEHIVTEIAERTQEFVQGLARMDQRSGAQASELLALAARLEDLTEQTKASLKKVYQVFLRQRRRANEALNQEIKELTAGELHATD